MSKEYVIHIRKECKNKELKCCNLFVASSRGCLNCVHYFIDIGSDLNATESFYEITALHAAACRDRYDVVKLLLESGASVDMESKLEGNLKAFDLASNPRTKALIASYMNN